MFRSNKCLSCKYELSQKGNVKRHRTYQKDKKFGILRPKIRKLEDTAKSLRFEKKRFHKEIGDLNRLGNTKQGFSSKK